MVRVRVPRKKKSGQKSKKQLQVASMASHNKVVKLKDQNQETFDDLQPKRDKNFTQMLEGLGNISQGGELVDTKTSSSRVGQKNLKIELETVKSLESKDFNALVVAYYHCLEYQAGVNLTSTGLNLVLNRRKVEHAKKKSQAIAMVHLHVNRQRKAETRLVRELTVEADEQGIKNCVFISRAVFTVGALEFARENRVSLMDERKLTEKINELPQEHILKVIAVCQ